MADYSTLLRDHVTLTCRSIDRIFLQAYVPKLQTVGWVCQYLRWQRGYRIPSSAAFGKIGDAYVAEVHRFAAAHGIPVLLVGCVEYDAGDAVSAEVTRQFAHDLGAEIDNRQIMAWAHEMTAWFALTSGDYHRVVAASEHGMSVAGQRDVGVQLAAQSAKAWARLKNRRKVEVALDRGQSLLEDLPRPSNPDHHFQIDPAKWHFYAMDAYRHVGAGG